MNKRSDLTLIIMVIALVGASIAVLYGRKMWADGAVAKDNSKRIVLEYQDTIDYLQPYLISGGMDAAAAALTQFASSVQRVVLQALIQGAATPLTDEQKVELLGAFLLHSANERSKSIAMPLLYRYFPEQPIFAWLMPTYEKIVPTIVSYDEQNGKKYAKNQLTRWINRSATHTITKDEPESLSALIAVHIKPDKKQANKLLEKVITEGRSTGFIPILVEQLNADANYSPDGKKTVLTLAVDKNNIALVKALLAQGSDSEKVIDKAVGNARQAAFEHGYSAIEQLLIKKGVKK